MDINQTIENINKEFSSISKDLTLKGYINSVNKSTNLLLIYQFTGNIFEMPNIYILSDIDSFLFRLLNGNKYDIYLDNDIVNQNLSAKIYITLNFE